MTVAEASDRLHRLRINSWCLYDWANSAFATTIMAALLPPYFSNVAAAGLEPAQASSIWGYAVSIAMLFTAFMGPIMGAAADYSGSKKRFMGGFLTLAVVFTACLYLIQEGDWLMAVIFYVLASVGNAGANIFYDSLLPHVARPDEMDRVSSKGFSPGLSGGWHPPADQPCLVHEARLVRVPRCQYCCQSFVPERRCLVGDLFHPHLSQCSGAAQIGA